MVSLSSEGKGVCKGGVSLITYLEIASIASRCVQTWSLPLGLKPQEKWTGGRLGVCFGRPSVQCPEHVSLPRTVFPICPRLSYQGYPSVDCTCLPAKRGSWRVQGAEDTRQLQQGSTQMKPLILVLLIIYPISIHYFMCIVVTWDFIR